MIVRGLFGCLMASNYLITIKSEEIFTIQKKIKIQKFVFSRAEVFYCREGLFPERRLRARFSVREGTRYKSAEGDSLLQFPSSQVSFPIFSL